MHVELPKRNFLRFSTPHKVINKIPHGRSILLVLYSYFAYLLQIQK